MNTEHTDKQITKEALEKLNSGLNQMLTWDLELSTSTTYDFTCLLHFGGRLIRFFVEIKTTVRETQLSKLIWQGQQTENFLLIATYINSTMARQLRENGINYFDQAGNAFLRIQAIKSPILIWIDGQRPDRVPAERTDQAFTKPDFRLRIGISLNPIALTKLFVLSPRKWAWGWRQYTGLGKVCSNNNF